MEQFTQDEIRLLNEVLPKLAMQLRGSMGNIHTALTQLVTPQGRESNADVDCCAAVLYQSYYRLMRVINNLSAAPMLLEDTLFIKRNLDLPLRLREMCRMAADMAQIAGITVECDVQGEHHIVSVHQEYFERMVWNLLSNAIKFTPKGGHVQVSLSWNGKNVFLRVQDSGCGISAQDMESVYERYCHAELSAPVPYGFGLGLPLCRNIAQRHGGTILLSSTVGEGTTVTVSVPDERSMADQIEQPRVDYTGGFSREMVELSDALPYRAFVQKFLD